MNAPIRCVISLAHARYPHLGAECRFSGDFECCFQKLFAVLRCL